MILYNFTEGPEHHLGDWRRAQTKITDIFMTKYNAKYSEWVNPWKLPTGEHDLVSAFGNHNWPMFQ